MDETTVNRASAPRGVAGVLVLVAASLAVASALHLSGQVSGRSELYDAGDAGIAEAVIGAVLLAGAITMLLAPTHARTAGLAVVGFAIVGFLVGLTITSQAGHWPDIAYHLAVLPILIGSLVVLVRAGNRR